MDRCTPDGFTLIEMLLAVAIVGILGAYAWPSYVDHVRRSRVAEATGQLAALRGAMEQHYLDYRNYGTVPACAVPMPPAGQFSYACTTASNGQAYTIVASGRPGASTAGMSYEIDQAGMRRTTALPAGWGTVPQDCWIVGKGGAC